MSQINLSERFPRMRPMKTPPPLFRINGCGVGLYGVRERDSETGAYVSTLCVCLLWVPILALRAYRVIRAQQGGWLFLGREPLSGFASLWNVILLGACMIGGGILGWRSYSASATYLAAQQLAQAQSLAAEGQFEQALERYESVIRSGTRHASTAETSLRRLLDQQSGEAAAIPMVQLLSAVLRLRERDRIFPNLFEKEREAAERLRASDPVGMSDVFDVIAPLAPDAQAFAREREALLEQCVKAFPNDARAAAKLAEILEARGDVERCLQLLSPHKSKLGDTEGARILGQLLAQQGDMEACFALLLPYAESRLKRLRDAEQTYESAVQQETDRLLETLNKGEGPAQFYSKYQAADETRKQTLVDEYLQSHIREDAGLIARRDAVIAAARIVPVALDLGIVRLHRARSMQDGAARRRELEAAEKTFLAIRGVAGETDEYRLFMGQVCYWLGRHSDGRKLLDELLASKQRDFQTLMSVGGVLREVGAVSEARTLVEEAWNAEADTTKKYQAASLRALLWTDPDDQIAWLERANQSDSSVEASLNAAKGDRAYREGRNNVAAEYLRKAIEAYKAMLENSASLNNGALACFSFYAVTRDQQAYEDGIAMLDRAIALDPDNSILMYNAGDLVLRCALRDIAGDEIDFAALGMNGAVELLRYLYLDQAGHERIMGRVRSNPGVARAMQYCDKATVLAPRNASCYANLIAVQTFLRDEKTLRDLLGRMRQASFDLADSHRRALDFYGGKDDARLRSEVDAEVTRLESMVTATRSSTRKATFAVAAGMLIQQYAVAGMLGEAVDLDEMVRLADDAHALSPSLGTQSALMAALMCRAQRRLEGESDEFSTMCKHAQRSLPSYALVALALMRAGPLQDLASAQPDVRRTAELVLAQSRAFPHLQNSWDWVMTRAMFPDEAARIAQAVRENEVDRITTEIRLLTAPEQLQTAFDACWRAMIEDREADGLEILRRAAEAGAPMPFDL